MPNLIGSLLRKQFALAFRPAILNRDVLAVGVPELAQAQLERFIETDRSRSVHQIADPWNFSRLLPARSKRPCSRCASDERYELAPPHSRPWLSIWHGEQRKG